MTAAQVAGRYCPSEELSYAITRSGQQHHYLRQKCALICKSASTNFLFQPLCILYVFGASLGSVCKVPRIDNGAAVLCG